MRSLIKIISDRKIKLGFIGCGRISDKHFEALEKHSKDIQVVAVCDIIEERAQKSAERMWAKAYTNIRQMLKNESFDIVTIATPNGLHPQHIMDVASLGVHIITEKPMAINLKNGVEILAHCKKNSAQLFVIHQNRFNDTAQEIWKSYKNGRFGKIYMITSNVFWTRSQDYYDKDGDWHGSKDIDGGAFYTQASHYIDFMQWIASEEPKKIYANLKTLARKIETEDTGIANIEWKNNILGSINVTMLTYPKNLEGSITILGEKGTVKIGGVAMNQIQHWEFEDYDPHDKEIMNANYDIKSLYGFGHVRYYENVIDVFRGKDVPLISGDEGLKSLKILEAIHRSNEKNQVVNMTELDVK